MITPVYPSQVTFRFPSRRCGGSPSQTIPSIYTISTTPTQPGVAIGNNTITDDALALFNPTVSLTSPSNSAVLQSLVQQWTLDYLNWFKYQIDEVLAGIAAVKPNGILQVTEFEYNYDKCFTRISSLPIPFQPDRLAHQITSLLTDCPATSDANSADPCVKIFGPPLPTQFSNQTTVNEFLVCFQDGRLTETYLQTVTYDCGCQEQESTCCVCTCDQLDIPRSDMIVTVIWSDQPEVRFLCGEQTSFTLPFSTTCQWFVLCGDVTDICTLPQVSMSCNSQGQLSFSIFFACDGPSPIGGYYPSGGLDLVESTENPFYLHFQPNSSCTGEFSTCSDLFTDIYVQPVNNLTSLPQCCIQVCIPNCIATTYTVTITQNGGTVATGTITTTGTGSLYSCITLNIGSQGIYTITVTGNDINYSEVYSPLTCCDTYFIPIYCSTFSAIGCHSLPAPEASIEINGMSYELPAKVCLNAYTGPYDYVISAPLFNDVSGSWNFPNGNAFPCTTGLQVDLTPQAGYFCVCAGGACPAPVVGWTLNDPNYGPVIMNWDAVSSYWFGTKTIDYPGGPGTCNPFPPMCGPGNIPLQYFVTCGGIGALTLSIIYPGFGPLVPGGTEFQPCPGPFASQSCAAGGSTLTVCPFEFEFIMESCCQLWPNGAVFTMTPP
jgi:hypothetical protein